MISIYYKDVENRQHFEVEESSLSIRDILRQRNLSMFVRVRVNGSPSRSTYRPRDGDEIYLTRYTPGA